MEANYHFETPITRLIVVSRFKDDNIKMLEKKYGKISIFFEKIPLDLESYLIPGACLFIDDMETELTSDKDVIKVILKCAFYYVHHYRIYCNIIFQSMNIFYASSKLHQLVHQANALILFRSANLFSMVEKVLNSFNLKLKSGETLFETFKEYCAGKKNRYIIILVHPKLEKPVVASSILYSDIEPYIVFT